MCGNCYFCRSWNFYWWLICLPITVATTAAAAETTEAVVGQCATTENSYRSLHCQFNCWAKDTSKLRDSLSIVQQHIESHERDYWALKYLVSQGIGNIEDAVNKFSQAAHAKNPNYITEANKIKQLAVKDDD